MMHPCYFMAENISYVLLRYCRSLIRFSVYSFVWSISNPTNVRVCISVEQACISVEQVFCQLFALKIPLLAQYALVTTPLSRLYYWNACLAYIVSFDTAVVHVYTPQSLCLVHTDCDLFVPFGCRSSCHLSYTLWCWRYQFID